MKLCNDRRVCPVPHEFHPRCDTCLEEEGIKFLIRNASVTKSGMVQANSNLILELARRCGYTIRFKGSNKDNLHNAYIVERK